MKGNLFVYNSLSVLNTSIFSNPRTTINIYANVATGGNQVKRQSDSTDAAQCAEIVMSRTVKNA